MRISTAVVMAASICVGGTALLSAKGPTVRLTVSGGGLQSPIEVTTPAALAHVWSDEFIGGPTAQPPARLPRYQIAFHVLPNGKREPKVMYVVTYVRDEGSGEALVYLPGPGEEHYGLNASTILRAGSGRWHHAVPYWAAAVNQSLVR
jgi:hypothetical protein